MEIISTNKGKQKICLDGFMYTKEKQVLSKSLIIWQCVKRKIKCKGRIYTSLDLSEIFNSKPHNHDANMMEIEVAKAKLESKHLASKSRVREQPASTSVSAEPAEHSAAARQLAGEKVAIKQVGQTSTLQSQTPPVPSSRCELAIPEIKGKGGVLDSWSLKEKLALGFSVQKNGDQNWVSVSRAIKAYGEPHRPADWFQPRNCAMQYSSLLEKVETPKRKRGDRGEIDLPSKQITTKLSIERIEELKKQVVDFQQQYKKLKRDVESINSGQWDEGIKEKWEEAQAAKEAEEEAQKEEEKKLKEMYAARIAAQNQLRGVRRASASSQGNISEADDSIQDSLLDAGDAALADEDSMDTSLLDSAPPNLSLSISSTSANEAISKANPPPSPLLSHLLKSSHKSPYSLQRIKQEQEQVLKQEQSAGDGGGGSTASSSEQSADLILGDVTSSASLTSQQSDADAASLPSTSVKNESQSEPGDTAPEQEQSSEDIVSIKQEVKEEASSQESITSSDNSSDHKLPVTTDTRPEDEAEETNDQRHDHNTDFEAESQDDEKSDLEGGAYAGGVEEEVSIKEEPASPASSVLSNVSETRTGRRSRGRVSRGRTSQRVTRKTVAERDDLSSKHSEAELSDDDVGRESSDDILSRLASQPSSLAAPAFTESVPNSPASIGISDTEDDKAYKTWKKSIMLVWRAAANHKFANVFLHPVRNDIAPGYRNVVLRPMDMLSIKKSIESGTLRSTAEFQRDMMLMFTNAVMYNSSNHDVYTMATQMYDDVMEQIEQYVSTQLMVQSAETKMLRPSRRGEADKEEDSKKRRSSVEQPMEGGKTKKRKARGDE